MLFVEKKYFWWLCRFKNLRSTTCKHRRKYSRKCDVIYRYLHIELIWRLLVVQYLQNNVIMKWTTRFIRFTGWIPLKYGSTTTPPIIAHCQKTPMSSVVFHTAISKPPIKGAPRVLTFSQSNFQNKSLLEDAPYIRDKTVYWYSR